MLRTADMLISSSHADLKSCTPNLSTTPSQNRNPEKYTGDDTGSSPLNTSSLSQFTYGRICLIDHRYTSTCCWDTYSALTAAVADYLLRYSWSAPIALLRQVIRVRVPATSQPSSRVPLVQHDLISVICLSVVQSSVSNQLPHAATGCCRLYDSPQQYEW